MAPRPARRGKGDSARCTRALAQYIEASNVVEHNAAETQDPAVPLFRSLDRRPRHKQERLTADGIYTLIVEYGNKIGVDVTPRLLRRTALARLSNVRRAIRTSPLRKHHKPE